MNLQSLLTAIFTTLTTQLDQTLSYATDFIPDELGRVIRNASSYIPKSFDLVSTAEFLLYFTAASLILGILSRIVLGKRSSLNHALSSAMGICLIYAVTIVVYTFQPWKLELLLAPLPFVTFAGEYLILLPLEALAFPTLCTEILGLVLVAFLVNLTDTLLPQGKGVFSWYLLRMATVLGAMALHLAARWAFRTFLPEAMVTYAPAILLGLLVFASFSGVVSLILGLIITLNSPFLGAMYTFFFSNIVGKQLSKAIFTTTLLCGLFYLLGYFGYTVIPIAAAALVSYLPIILLLLLLWYLIGHVL